MPFKRIWDSSCPHVWQQWKAQGVTWTIQDLPPEDDEQALQLLEEQFLPDEALCAAVNLTSSPESVEGSRKFWRSALSQRTSLACYREEGGTRTLVALNVCPVKCADDPHDNEQFSGKEWQQVIGVLIYMESKLNVFETLNVDKYLSGAGLLVMRENRGERLGSKLLDAREHLCASLGIEATATIFSGPASQKSASRSGFVTFLDVHWNELARAGFTYPPDEKRGLKLMAKKFSKT